MPPDLQDIQYSPPWVWNCDKTRFDMNGIWRKIFDYRLFVRYMIWNWQTSEIETLCYTELILTCTYDQFFIPPLMVHHSSNYNQSIYCSVPRDWVVHNKTSGYIYFNGHIKATTHISAVCCSHPFNPQVILYYYHGSHLTTGKWTFFVFTTPNISSLNQMNL